MTNHNPRITNQLGIVSILVTMVMMMVITLVVLTYSQIIRREQRQTLDRQLNSQAFYAAESAINTVNKAYDDAIASGSSTSGFSKSPCSMTALPAWLSGYATTIPSGPDIAVTCLTVDPLGYNLSYSSIGQDTSQIGHLKSTGPVIGKIEVAWQSDAGGNTLNPGTSFTPLAGWASVSSVPVLRIDLIPNLASFDLTSLYDTAQTYFLYPHANVLFNNVDSSLADTRGAIVLAACNNTINATKPKACKATILVSGGTDFYIRIRPIYSNADVVITPTTSASAGIQITGGQVTIDATGRSSDVLKRISVRRAIDSNAITPGFAIETNLGICKKFDTRPGVTNDPCP